MISSRVRFGAAAIVAIGLVGGCQSQEYDSSTAASGELQAASTNLNETRVRVDESLQALNSLMSAGGGDLRPAYDTYARSVNAMEASAKEMQARAAAMQEKGTAYFAKWDAEMAQIHNEDIKQRSDARKAEVQKSFTRVSDLYQKTRTEFDPFLSDMKDIRAALGTDLTPGGIESIGSSATRARKEGLSIRDTLVSLTSELKALGAKMSPQMPDPNVKP